MMMDFQHFATDLVNSNELIANAKHVLQQARSKNMKIIHITFEIRPGFPNEKFRTVGFFKQFVMTDEKPLNDRFWQIHEELKPLPSGIK